MRSFSAPSFLILAQLAAAGVAERAARATNYCEDINNDITIVGEIRYRTDTGSDACYANAYGDGGDELSIPGNIPLAGAFTSATNLRFHAYAHHLDFTTSDCSNVTFQMTMKYSSTGYAGCPTGYNSAVQTMTVNSCAGTNSDLYFAGKSFGHEGNWFNWFWQFDLSVSTATGCTQSDTGCFPLYSQGQCTLVNF